MQTIVPDGLTDAPQTTPSAPPELEQPSADSDSMRWVRWNWLAIVALTGVAITILLLQSLLHGHLTGFDEYDDGVYFGSSLQLLHGLLPYRDYAFIQPPLLTVWLLPAATLSIADGTATAFEAARLFIDLVAAANVLMVGLLVRRRPVIQVIVSVGAMAAFPGMVRSAQTVLLEPLLVFACLAGLLCLFRDGQLSRSWFRILAGGIFFGLAGATKLWAIFPFLAVLLVAIRLGPTRWATLVFGGAAGFIGSTLPFFLGAPKAFIQQVFVIQAIRSGAGYTPWERLADLTGLPGLFALVETHKKVHGRFIMPATGAILVVSAVLAVIALLCLLAFVGRKRAHMTDLEWLALLATVLTGAGLMVAPTYYYHYGGFEAPFVALLYGAVIARLVARLMRERTRPRLAGAIALSALAVGLVGTMVEVRIDLIESAGPVRQAAQVVGNVIPRHGCVVAGDAAAAILADRFTSYKPKCPHVVDYLAQERVLDHGADQSQSDVTNTKLQVKFMSWAKAADVLLVRSTPGWSARVWSYVLGHFYDARSGKGEITVYIRDGISRASKPSQTTPVR
jgi:hypothetical protein